MVATTLRAVLKTLYRLCFYVSVLNIYSPVCGAESYRICAVKSREYAHFNSALTGFSRTLRNKGVKASVTVFTMKSGRDTGDQIMREMADSKPDLILTIGTPATEFARERCTETPIVFCMVLNPVADGLASSLESSGCNLTGASLDIPARAQFKVLKSIQPSTRRIGVVYNPEKSACIIAEASRAAQELGCELIARPIAGESDIPRAMDDLRLRNIDFLWSISDGVVFNSFTSIQFIILYSLQNRIPFMGLSPSFVKSGALIALSCDPEDNGRQAGEQAVLVLAGKNPADIPIAIPRKTSISYNARIAEQLGIRIPSHLSYEAQD